MLNSRALVIATILGTVLQIAMVLAGHSNPAIAKMFAVGGMGFSFLAGIVYAATAHSRASLPLAVGGSLAGGLCAVIGIAISCFLGDVTPIILVIGTLSSAITGAIGGLIGRVFVRTPNVA